MAEIGHNSAAFGQEMIEGADAREFWQFVDFIRCSGLPAPVRHVAIEIWLHMRPWKMNANPSAARIAQFTGLSERTVRTAFGALAKAPFFSVSAPKKGRGNTRTFRAVSFQAMSELSTALDAKTLSNLQRNDDENRANIAVFQARKPASPAPLSIVKPAPAAVNEYEKPAPVAVLDDKTCSSFQENLQELHPKLPNRSYQESKEERSDDLLSPVGDQPGETKQSNPYSQLFEDFWKKFPRREGKGKAYAAWKRLTGDDRKKASAALDAQMPTLLQKLRDERGNFCPHASTWLSQRRFDDDVGAHASPDQSAAAGQSQPPGYRSHWDAERDEKIRRQNQAIEDLKREYGEV
jgi:hypothetical protein